MFLDDWNGRQNEPERYGPPECYLGGPESPCIRSAGNANKQAVVEGYKKKKSSRNLLLVSGALLFLVNVSTYLKILPSQ